MPLTSRGFLSKSNIQKLANTMQKTPHVNGVLTTRSGLESLEKSGLMYEFYLYCAKEEREPTDYDHLSASA